MSPSFLGSGWKSTGSALLTEVSLPLIHESFHFPQKRVQTRPVEQDQPVHSVWLSLTSTARPITFCLLTKSGLSFWWHLCACE